MFKLIGLDHIVLRTNDAPRLITFYQEILGCTIERRLDIGLTQLRAGASLIDIVAVDSTLGKKGGSAPDPRGGGKNLDHFCLRVEPFNSDTIMNALARQGITGEPAARVYGAEGFGASVYLADPDGNRVELKGPADEAFITNPAPGPMAGPGTAP